MLAALGAGATGTGAKAQTFPAKPITIVVPAPPGGANDTIARLVGPGMSAALGQSVVITNLGGAGGNLASERVANAAPDGHTLLVGFLSSIAINPFTYASMPVNPMTQLEPVALTSRGPLALATHPDLPVRTLAEFADYVRARPGQLNYGSTGAGGATHVAMAMICQNLGLDMVHVPYRGSGPAMQDLLAGRLAVTLDALLVHQPFIQQGKLRGLVVTGDRRVSTLPDVPSMVESGHPEMVMYSWNGIFAPAGTPPEVLAKVHAAVAKALTDSEVQARLAGIGIAAGEGSREDFVKLVRQDYERWGRVVRTANIRAEQ